MRIVLVIALLAGCSSEELSGATSLVCPTPGRLPFHLGSSGFQSSQSKAIADVKRRNKDEASDTLGNPGGATASVYLAESDRPGTGAIAFRGAKARTDPTQGNGATPLAGENVSLWSYDATGKAWHEVGHGTTDADGVYQISGGGFVAANGEPVYAMLEADGSCAEHFDYLYPPGTRVVVADIDGTLTLSDLELLTQLGDPTYVPKMMGAADRLLQAWDAKHYPVIYLTARPSLYRAESRGWLDELEFPAGALITQTPSSSATADVYKTAWMQRITVDFGWEVIAAYGNADTDITAYENAQVPKDRTFIVGPFAGTRGTQPVENADFTAHIAAFVTPYPPAGSL